MKVIILLIFIVLTQKSYAYQNTERAFTLPQDAKDFDIVSVKKILKESTNVSLKPECEGLEERDIWNQSRCWTPEELTQEEVLRFEITYTMDPSKQESDYRVGARPRLVIDFPAAEFTQPQIKNIPDINWIGMGRGKNREYAQELIGFHIENKSQVNYGEGADCGSYVSGETRNCEGYEGFLPARKILRLFIKN